MCKQYPIYSLQAYSTYELYTGRHGVKAERCSLKFIKRWMKNKGKKGMCKRELHNYTGICYSVVLYEHSSVSCLCCLGELVILGYVMTYEDTQSLWINYIYHHKGKLNWYFDWTVCLTYMLLQMLYRALGLWLCSKQIIFLNLATSSIMVVVRGATFDFREKMKNGTVGSLLGILSCSEPKLMQASL